MLSAIKEIGDLTTKKAWVSPRPLEGKIVSVVLTIENMSFEIDLEDFDSEKMTLYLFKSGSSRGNAPSPFAPIREPMKTFEKIRRWIKNFEKIKDIPDIDKVFLSRVNKILVDNKISIVSAIKDKTEGLLKKKGEGRFLTIKFSGEKRYLGEYEIFRRGMEDFAIAKLKKSASLNQTCSICGLTKEEVSGKTDVFKFYTIDKPGFISGGFKESQAWKNFPVCLDCKILLENGKKFIENRLNFGFYGLNYQLIPRLLVGGKEIFEGILNILSDTAKVVGLRERLKRRITSDENEILEYLSEMRDVLTLNFLFLKREFSAERILLLIEDVFPSRIREIFKSKGHVDMVFGEDYNFGRIRTFYSKSDEGKRESDLDKYYLEIVDRVFRGRKIDFPFLLKFYMAVIRREFINDRYFSFRVKDALMNTIFFENLGLITFEEVGKMDESIFEDEFKNYGNTFASPVRRGLFLLGALTQKLLNIQAYKRQGAKPFMKVLKSLKMNQKDIKGLLPAVENKLVEYDSFDTWRKLAQESSQYLLAAGDEWKLSIDEINFYFVCGMNLMEKVTKVLYPEKE